MCLLLLQHQQEVTKSTVQLHQQQPQPCGTLSGVWQAGTRSQHQQHNTSSAFSPSNNCASNQPHCNHSAVKYEHTQQTNRHDHHPSIACSHYHSLADNQPLGSILHCCVSCQYWCSSCLDVPPVAFLELLNESRHIHALLAPHHLPAVVVGQHSTA